MTSSLTHHLGLGSSLPKTILGPKLASILKFRTPYLFLPLLNLATSNLAPYTAWVWGIVYQEATFRTKTRSTEKNTCSNWISQLQSLKNEHLSSNTKQLTEIMSFRTLTVCVPTITKQTCNTNEQRNWMLRLVTISQTNKLIKYMTIYSVQSDRQTTALCSHVVHSSVRPSVCPFVRLLSNLWTKCCQHELSNQQCTTGPLNQRCM